MKRTSWECIKCNNVMAPWNDFCVICANNAGQYYIEEQEDNNDDIEEENDSPLKTDKMTYTFTLKPEHISQIEDISNIMFSSKKE